MTELERLVRQIRVHYPVTLSLNEENDLVEMLNRKYSVRLRNTDSSADNTSGEQLHSDEELMSKIEDMVATLLSDRTSSDFCGCWEGDMDDRFPEAILDFRLEFGTKLKSLFQTHRNTISTAVNVKDDNLVDDEELMSKIETLLFSLSTTMIDDYYGNEVIAISGKNKVAKEIVKVFKDHQNSNPRPIIQQVAKYSDRGETESKIAFKNSLRHQVGELVTADQELDQIVENIVNFFVDTVNPVFRALNDSDEQSIIK